MTTGTGRVDRTGINRVPPRVRRPGRGGWDLSHLPTSSEKDCPGLSLKRLILGVPLRIWGGTTHTGGTDPPAVPSSTDVLAPGTPSARPASRSEGRNRRTETPECLGGLRPGRDTQTSILCRYRK